MSKSSKITVKIVGQEYSIIKKVKEFIDTIVEETMVLEPIAEKSEDIYKNITEKYYYAKKYVYLSTNSKSDTVYGEIYAKVEDVINDNSTPREYDENVKVSVKYLRNIIDTNNRINQSSDTWEKDFQMQNDVSDSVMTAINSVIYDACVDEYNKPSFAETVLDAIEIGISESLEKI